MYSCSFPHQTGFRNTDTQYLLLDPFTVCLVLHMRKDSFLWVLVSTYLIVVTGWAFSARAAGIHASSWHSLTRVCLMPSPAARPPAAFRDTTHQPSLILSSPLISQSTSSASSAFTALIYLISFKMLCYSFNSYILTLYSIYHGSMSWQCHRLCSPHCPVVQDTSALLGSVLPATCWLPRFH